LQENVPHFPVLVAGPLLVIVVQVFLLRHALRQRRAGLVLEAQIEAAGWSVLAQARIPPRWPAIVAGALVLLVPGLAHWSIATARAGMIAGITTVASAESATQISRSLSGMFNAIPWAINLFVPCALLAIVSVTMTIATRQRIRRLSEASRDSSSDVATALRACRGPGADNLTLLPVLLFVGGLIPVLWGAWSYALEMVRGLSALGRLPAAEKVPHLLGAIERSRALFAERAWLIWPGTAVATLVGAALLVSWARRWRHTPRVRTTVLVSQLCIAGAIGLFLAGAPFRAENHLPWPAEPASGERLMVDEPQSPKLQGPDGVERAPVLWFGEQFVTLDGYVTDPGHIEDYLRVGKQNYRLLNPDAGWRGVLDVLAAAQTPTDKLGSYLKAAARADYHSVYFVFTKRESLARPILGPLTRVQASAARVTLVASSGETQGDDVTLVKARTFRTYGELAVRLVELRRTGQEVALHID
jgi:hypothetical protein